MVIATLTGTLIALLVSWWTEFLYVFGLTGAASLAEAVETVSRPGTFLITPLAATSTFLLAALLGGIFPNADLDKTRNLTWRAVVKGEKTPPT